MRRTSIERHVAGLPLLVVMPDGGRGFYSDAQEGFAYERHVIEDVIGFVDRTFQTIPERRGRVSAAFRWEATGDQAGVKYPNLFCSAVSHSGALGIARRSPREELRPELARIFGPNPAGGPDDPFALAEQMDRAQLPALRIDCGLDDGLLEGNRDFHRHLAALDIPHEYEEFPGAIHGTTGCARPGGDLLPPAALGMEGEGLRVGHFWWRNMWRNTSQRSETAGVTRSRGSFTKSGTSQRRRGSWCKTPRERVTPAVSLLWLVLRHMLQPPEMSYPQGEGHGR